MPNEIPISLQTMYADLVDRAATAALSDAFPGAGTFVSKAMRGKRYWYFQTPVAAGRAQQYVGPETPELLERIAHHKQAQDTRRDRQTIVSTLVRSAGFQRPLTEIGEVVNALADAGVFRLRGVLVGTVAYQTYPAMLGVRLPNPLLQTGDVDIAQFQNVSVAVDDKTPPILEVLKRVDPSFRPIQHQHDPRRTTTYEAAKLGLRVDFLTPNTGPDSDAPETLPAFGTDAQPLRFLDFLIHEPVPAVLLHGIGVYVQVPAPERYAVHKLIVARRRRAGTGKDQKDILQAEGLLEALCQRRPRELAAAWREAFARGETWRDLLGQGLGLIDANTRDTVLKLVDAPRAIIPGLELTFAAPIARYDFDRDIVSFIGEANKSAVRCAISREALDDYARATKFTNEDRLNLFRANREKFEKLAQIKYRDWPVEDAATVLIKTGDLEALMSAAEKPRRR